MTHKYRVAGAFILLSGVAVAASGCMGPTYGTGTPANEQLVEDIGGVLSLSPGKKEQPTYQPRGQLVKPRDPKLVAPEKNLASKDNPQWLESPEETRTRLRAEADDHANDPNYRSPLAVSITERKVLSPEQQAAQYREARKIQQGNYTDRRRFVSDPPLEYRQLTDASRAEDLGEPEKDKEKRRKKEAEIAGSGRKWWQVWD